MTHTNLLEGREILIEMIPIGVYVRVTAFDTKTMTEVSIQGPRNTPEQVLKNNAIRRLAYVLRKAGHID